mmetsp:Transcript_107352/g.272454  ORF Transcript_107352/g.272454 Transcript_107352/m.272454 type:complete len:301 (-) Transcript_107352:228-1130(-)
MTSAAGDGGCSPKWVEKVFGCCEARGETIENVDSERQISYTGGEAPAETSSAAAAVAPAAGSTSLTQGEQSPPGQTQMAEPKTTSKNLKVIPLELTTLKLLDEHRALLYADWCCYLCCGGCGTSVVSSPPSIEYKCCLCWQKCRPDQETSTDGCCSCMQSCCCCTWACQLPSRSGAPICKVCNLECCTGMKYRRDLAGKGHGTDKRHRHDTMQDFFVPCYCLWGGCAFLPVMEFSNRCTCCFCEATSQNMLPACDEEALNFGWCGYFCACHKCYAQLKLPCLCKEIPILACCGWKCRHRA